MIFQEKTPELDKLYRHYKGGIYRVLGFAKCSETLKTQVIYCNEMTNEMWVRPNKEFMGKHPKHKVKRFERIE
ncbi:hypothetical protein J22TS1_43930 [Siminovitchia terrae]|uniref:DUF1653 domain-containing protein n=1 Tax=Siminovitchia terrae TaxID=1914933 RepID=UPI001B1E7733|nr:DUF1653 domain-containing protein [Siminovitchia terrae]GIN93342.1 hypothetical protein J22TS1_43930 [Siminovitchia terrae]